MVYKTFLVDLVLTARQGPREFRALKYIIHILEKNIYTAC